MERLPTDSDENYLRLTELLLVSLSVIDVDRYGLYKADKPGLKSGADHRRLLSRRAPWLPGDGKKITLDDVFRPEPRAWIMGRYRAFPADRAAGMPATTLLDVASDYYCGAIKVKTDAPESSPLHGAAAANLAAFELCLKKQFPEGAIYIIDMGFGLRVPAVGPDKFKRLLKSPDSRIIRVR